MISKRWKARRLSESDSPRPIKKKKKILSKGSTLAKVKELSKRYTSRWT